MSNILVDRLEKLKQATIVNDAEYIDFNDDLEFYDTLLEKTFNGSFDDLFLTNQLDELSEEDKKKAFEVARKYKSLCFFGGDSNYWADSIEGVYLSDYDLICMRLLDNYDFILGLSINDEESLKTLVELQQTEVFSQKSIIDYLRNVFVNDKVLKDSIRRISNDYDEFTVEQKALLCLYPDGVLYKVDENDNIENISNSELLREIKISLLGTDDDNFHLGDALKNLSDDDFEDIINYIFNSYQNRCNSFKQY